MCVHFLASLRIKGRGNTLTSGEVGCYSSLQLDLPNQSDLNGFLMNCLTDFAMATPSLHDRLQLSVNITPIVLSLGMSGWIPLGWNPEQLNVYKHLHKGRKSIQPYLSYASVPSSLAGPEPEPDNTILYTEAVLSSLGVIFLELMDNEVLEKTSYWEKNCPDGQKHYISEFCAAIQWQHDAALRQSHDLPDPIKRRLKSQFSHPADLTDCTFLQEFLMVCWGPSRALSQGGWV